MAKTYGWTPAEVDQVDAELLDWLSAIQRIEYELEDEARKKQEQQLKRTTGGHRSRR